MTEGALIKADQPLLELKDDYCGGGMKPASGAACARRRFRPLSIIPGCARSPRTDISRARLLVCTAMSHLPALSVIEEGPGTTEFARWLRAARARCRQVHRGRPAGDAEAGRTIAWLTQAIATGRKASPTWNRTWISIPCATEPHAPWRAKRQETEASVKARLKDIQQDKVKCFEGGCLCTPLTKN